MRVYRLEGSPGYESLDHNLWAERLDVERGTAVVTIY